jgi:hypothetical protein
MCSCQSGKDALGDRNIDVKWDWGYVGVAHDGLSERIDAMICVAVSFASHKQNEPHRLTPMSESVVVSLNSAILILESV